MTTPSGKPPSDDEQTVDSDWESLGAETPRRDSSHDASVQRGGRAPAAAEERPIYGIAVPYGGDDRTEEIEPIALDMPFNLDERPRPGPSRSGAPRPPQAPPSSSQRRGHEPKPREQKARERELKAPVAQLVLSDLFDSTPPPPGSSLMPPDPAAFSSRPPPAGRAPRAPAPASPEPRAVPGNAPSSPWTLSRKSADSKYFDSVPRSNTPAPAGSQAAGPRPSAPSLGRPGAATPVRAGQALRSKPAGAAPPAAPPGSWPPAAPAAPRSGGASIPATRTIPLSDRPSSGGVVALPSINVLAEGAPREVRKPMEKRPSGAPAASTGASTSAVTGAAARAPEPSAPERSAPERSAPEWRAPEPLPPVETPVAAAVHERPADVASQPEASAAPLAAPEPDAPEPDAAPDAAEPEPRAVSAAEPLPSTAEAAATPSPAPEHDDDVEPVTGRTAAPLAEAAPDAPEAAAAEVGDADAGAATASAADVATPRPAEAEAQAEPSTPAAPSAPEAAPSAHAEEAPPSELLDVSAPEPTRQRRSVPTLESFGAARARPAAGARSTSPEKWSAVAEREAAQAASADSAARFPSEVPTSRPPDVLLGSDAPPSPELRPSERPSRPGAAVARAARRPSSPPQLAVAVPPSTKTGQINLPSVMLGEDVEAEPNSAALRRAQRAARQTVRIELPEGFGRPGSPMMSGFGAMGTPADSEPLSRPDVGFAGLPRKKLLTWAAVAVFLLGALVLLLARPRSGSLVVTALGPGHRAVDSVQIFVDDRPLCATSPCLISGLKPGTHQLKASAPGLASQGAQDVEITAGEEAAANIELAAAEADMVAGGFRISGDAALTLSVDERRVGKLPQTVSGLSSGKHWIKLDREDGSAPIEKAVLIRPGEVIDVDAAPAKRDKALVTIRLTPESEGASVTLDDAFLLDFPAELELDPKAEHVLTATKPGYEDFTLNLQLEGETEKVIDIALTPLDGASARRARPAAKPAALVRKAAPATKATGSGAALDPSQGLLNVSSVPPSQIILNGRPLGTTPKTAIVVPGDSLQTIVFVHPKMGRRRAQKFVPAGKERTVSIRF